MPKHGTDQIAKGAGGGFEHGAIGPLKAGIDKFRALFGGKDGFQHLQRRSDFGCEQQSRIEREAAPCIHVVEGIEGIFKDSHWAASSCEM